MQRHLYALVAILGLGLAGCARPAPTSPPAPPVPPAASVPPAAPPAPPDETPADANEEPHLQLPKLAGDNWQSLFDGTSMAGWKVTDFAGHGEVELAQGRLVMGMGAMLTGVNLVATNGIPAYGYELATDLMKVDGSDFFCGLTFVVGDSCCSLIVGGWGGGLVGISSLDGNDASMNETTKFKGFPPDHWYRIRVQVTREKIQAWIGAEKLVDVKIENRRISVRPGEIELSQPFGICTFQTTTAMRRFQWRKLE